MVKLANLSNVGIADALFSRAMCKALMQKLEADTWRTVLYIVFSAYVFVFFCGRVVE